MLTQETMSDLYTNPQFPLAEVYAETVATVCFALISGPAIPGLNLVAALSVIFR